MLKAFSKQVFFVVFLPPSYKIPLCAPSPMRLSFHLSRKLALRDKMDNNQDISHQKALCHIWGSTNISAVLLAVAHFFSRPSLASCYINLCNLNPCHCLALFMINAQTVTRASTGLHRLTQVEGNPKRRYCCRIWVLHCLDKLSAAVKTPRESEEIAEGSGR